jgi:ParB family chromosome partitioning protein
VQKKGLGRGLRALLPDEPLASNDRVQEVAISRISTNPGQPRQQFNPETIAELAASIREHGVVQPVLLRAIGDDFELVAGERRLRAAREAGLETVPAIVRELSDGEALEIALVENLQREDLNPMDQAEAYRKLSDDFGLSQEDIARRVGKSRPQITNTMRLLQLEPGIQGFVREGKLSMGHARALLALETETVQRKAAERMVAKSMSVREAESHVSALIGRPQRPVEKTAADRRAPEIEDVETQMRAALGTRVRITGDANRGKLEIHYFSAEDLERVVTTIIYAVKGRK